MSKHDTHECALCGKPQPCSQHGRTPVTDADFAELSQDLAEMARPSEVEAILAASSTEQLKRDHAALLAVAARVKIDVMAGSENWPDGIGNNGEMHAYNSGIDALVAALTSPVIGESDSDPIVRCASCGCHDEATVTLREDVIDHLHKGRITVVVPVWTCNACGESWTGHRAEAIRDAVVAATPSPAATTPTGEQR